MEQYQIENPVYRVVSVLVNEYIPHMGWAIVDSTMKPISPADYTADKIISDIERNEHVRIDAVRKKARGARKRVIILVVDKDRALSTKVDGFRALIRSAESSAGDSLSDLIVVADSTTFDKKNIVSIITTRQKEFSTPGADSAGTIPFYNMYPYFVFVSNLTKHVDYDQHEIVESQGLHILGHKISDLPMILTTDPAIIWCGARENQIVKVTRFSPTTLSAIIYRRVIKGSIA